MKYNRYGVLYYPLVKNRGKRYKSLKLITFPIEMFGLRA